MTDKCYYKGIEFRNVATAPKDGSLLRLLVEFSENSTEDEIQAPTIGSNSFLDSGEDEWLFAGWSWEQDCYTEGQGKVIGWLPMFDEPTPSVEPLDADEIHQMASEVETERKFRLSAEGGWCEANRVIAMQREKLDAQEDQLAERDALLRDFQGRIELAASAIDDDERGRNFVKILRAISARAEPCLTPKGDVCPGDGVGPCNTCTVERAKEEEELARAIYEGWANQEGFSPWVERGNSIKQCEARRIARTKLNLEKGKR